MAKSEIKSYLDINFKGLNDNKNIKVFTNMEYKFVFYNETYGTKETTIGLVMDVYPDQIKIKCIKKENGKVDCRNCGKIDCDKRKQWPSIPPMPTCECILNPPDNSKYNEPTILFIPINNIMDISYINTNPPINNKPPHHHKREGVKVMILGISATIVKAIVIQLKFFDDNCDEAVKYIELEKNKIYDITYEDKDGTIYESRAKIVNIEECNHNHHEIHHHHGPIVRENIGMYGEVYNDKCISETEKDHFMKEPPVRNVKLVVDTSDQFDGNYEVIMLNSIRDCSLVE